MGQSFLRGHRVWSLDESFGFSGRVKRTNPRRLVVSTYRILIGEADGSVFKRFVKVV